MTESAQLDELIEKLEEMVRIAARPIIGDTSKAQWDDIFELMPVIQDNFKSVRYPQKFDREQAWVKFNDIRNKAFQSKKEQFEEKSKFHYKELWEQLNNADYNWRLDSIAKDVLWGEFKVTIETMKDRGAMLKEAGNYFKENKFEMTKQHKNEIHEKYTEVKEAHDVFWGRVREYREEKKQAWEERQAKSHEIKERLITNREKLQTTLSNTEDYKSKVEDQIRTLEEKIDNAYSDSYREKHEEFLSERQDKLREVEEQIDKIKGWIKEIDDKLDNWT